MMDLPDISGMIGGRSLRNLITKSHRPIAHAHPARGAGTQTPPGKGLEASRGLDGGMLGRHLPTDFPEAARTADIFEKTLYFIDGYLE